MSDNIPGGPNCARRQYYNHCFCDNAGAMSARAPEAECDTPCSDGGSPDDDGGNPLTQTTETCGGAWRNSVYQQSTNNWEKAGYDDRGWQAAADLGPNGVAPWNRRPTISENAHWIWTMDPGVALDVKVILTPPCIFHL